MDALTYAVLRQHAPEAIVFPGDCDEPSHLGCVETALVVAAMRARRDGGPWLTAQEIRSSQWLKETMTCYILPTLTLYEDPPMLTFHSPRMVTRCPTCKGRILWTR